MRIQKATISIFTVCLLALVISCRVHGGGQTLLGKWECTDLSKVEHVSQFAKYVMEFRTDKEIVSYLVDQHGQQVQRDVATYCIRDDILEFQDGPERYRFIIKSNTLSLTVVKSTADDDVGKTLEFRRKE